MPRSCRRICVQSLTLTAQVVFLLQCAHTLLARVIKVKGQDTYSTASALPFTNNNDNNTRLTALCPGLSGWAGTRKVNQSGFTGARDSERQWYQLGHIQICTSPETDNHASIPPLRFYRPDALLPPNQQRQSTEGIITHQSLWNSPTLYKKLSTRLYSRYAINWMHVCSGTTEN